MAVRKYPWEEWFGAQRVQLRRGIDYQLSQSMMFQSIKNNLSLRKMRRRVTDTGEGFVIEVFADENDEVSRPNPLTVPAKHSNALAPHGCLEEETEGCDESLHDGKITTKTADDRYDNTPRPQKIRR